MTTIKIAACAFPIDKQAKSIQLFPAGEFSAPFGAMMGAGPWRLNQDSAIKLMSACSRRSNDILIDYEHQSLTANKQGHAAPAAGWINPASLIWTDAGLYAQNPDWKAKAAAMIDADEYRYLSPVFTYDSTTGTPLNILSVALTNTPAIDGMAAVSLAALMVGTVTPTEPVMDLSELMERLCYLLNLPITTTPTDMSAELDKLKGMIGGGATAAASLPELLTGRDTEIAALKSAIGMLKSAQPDPAKFVPIADFLALHQQRLQAATDTSEQKVAALIAAHPDVIIPALEPWATGLGRQDFAKLETYINNTKPIAALTSNQTQGVAPLPQPDQLTPEDIDVCSQMGVDQASFIKNKQVKS